MATTEDGTISTEEVVVVKPDGERNIEDLNNTQVIIQLQSNTAREEFDGTPMSGMADEEHPEETEGGDVEIGCPITCGDSQATLLVKKFVCPGINVKCVKYDDQLISPKQFVHISGKATLKDWKRAIRMGGVMLRKIMDSGQLDFYQHTTLCTNTCRSTKFDLLINNTRFPPDNSGLSSASSQAQESFGNGKTVGETERPSEKADWSSRSAKSVNKESQDISEDTLNFWKGIADVGLLGEVVTKISTELLDLLNSLHLLKESVVLQNTEVAVLSNLGQVFGLLNSVKKMVVKRRLQTDPSQEQILGILCKLELQLAEQRKQQQIQALLSCPHPAKTITTVKRQTKRPRLQRPVTTNTLLTSSINHQPSLTPQLFTLLSPISLPSFGQPFTVAGLPITSLAQSSNTVTLLPTGSQLFTQYMVTEDGKADSITLHTSSNLTLVNTSPMHDSSQFGSMVKPVELLHLSQPDVCAEAVPIEAQVLDGAMLVQQESMQGEDVEPSQEHTVIEISPCSGEGVGVMVQQQTGESARDKAGLVQRRMEVTIAEEQEAQKREVQELELGANGHVPAVQIAVVKENTQEERLPS